MVDMIDFGEDPLDAIKDEVERYVLERTEMSARCIVSTSVLRQCRGKVLTNTVAPGVSEIVLTYFAPGKTFTHEVHVPVSWVDHFIVDHPWVGRVLKRVGIKRPRMRAIEHRTTNVCPHADIDWHRNPGAHIEFMYRQSTVGPEVMS